MSFYERIAPFTRFSELTDERHYHPVPDDWSIVITDVRGSTRAIEENRYKDVNLLGASSIAAVLNALGGRSIPYVFGGDGATILVANEDVDKIRPALLGSQRLAREVFALDLRTGVVPVSELRKQGKDVRVAKFALAPKATIAVLQGSGLSEAEAWVKDPQRGLAYAVSLDAAGAVASADFAGLSCRWNPVKAKNGAVMSLLVRARSSQKPETQIYSEVLREIEEITSRHSAKPIEAERVDRRVDIRNLIKEMRLQTVGQSWLAKAKRLGQIFLAVATMQVLLRTGWRMGSFSAEQYLVDMAANSDYQKFDDMLRMVRDVSTDQQQKILAALEARRLAGEIVYGTHFSNEALLTCLVFQLDNHIHFVDGGGGGYALAAKQLKAQLSALKSSDAAISS